MMRVLFFEIVSEKGSIAASDTVLSNISVEEEITISIRYTPADGKIGVAYHIDDDGNKVRMGGIYDPIKGEIVFDSTHCSLYMVVDEDSSNSGLSYTAIFVGIAVAVVAVIAVAIMLYVRKR